MRLKATEVYQFRLWLKKISPLMWIISTAFVESTVNEVISKRMVKGQQMKWTKKGAHLLLKLRIKNLNNELRDHFCKWYPGLNNINDSSCKEQRMVA